VYRFPPLLFLHLMLILGAASGAGAVDKVIAIQPKPSDTVRFNFQARLRGEIRENVDDFNGTDHAATDDQWLLHRIRLGIEWQPIEWLRIAAQTQDARESFSGRADVPLKQGAEGDDAFDLRLASLEIGDPQQLSLKLGRQVLSYGDDANFAYLMLTLNY
jgi:hypothetical protein